jgi:hypothetical protein
MTIKFAFTEDGTPWTSEISKLLEPHIVADIPEDVALWRIKYNTETEVVDIRYPDLTDTEAETKLDEDIKAAAAAEAEAAA